MKTQKVTGSSFHKECIERMEHEAIEEMLHYHEKSSKQKAKDIIRRMAGRYVPPNDMIFWPTGLLANALMESKTGADRNESRVKAVEAYFEQWTGHGMPVYYVDDTLCGVALIDLYLLTGKETYKAGADKMAAYLLELEERYKDEAGSIPYRPAQGNGHIYVDAVGMICPFLIRYGLAFEQDKAVQIALKQIKNMLQYGMDDRTGLPYHGFQYKNQVKYGIIGWGRAVGWLMLGMADVICSLRQEEVPEFYQAEGKKLEEAFGQLIAAILPYQRKNGAFGWQLQAMDGPEDSSATAMIAWALCKVLEKKSKQERKTGEMPDKDAERICRKAIEYLQTCEKDGKIYNCSGECLGFSQYPQVYDAYPWALGPAYAVLAQDEC